MLSKTQLKAPPKHIFHRLTIDSNELLNTFIQRIVEEESLESSWSDVIKGALGDFGEYIESRQLFRGLKASRKAQNRAIALEEQRARANRAKERERLKESKAVKAKGNEKEKEKEKAKTPTEEATTWSRIMDLKLKEIHALTLNSSSTPSSSNPFKHLFLTVAPPPATLPDTDSDFDIITASGACSFNAETYSFPYYDDGEMKQGEGGIVICGLDSWKPDNLEANPQIVGGMFFFKDIICPTTYDSLTNILKLSIYTYLSLKLEQHVLSNFHITLHYPEHPPHLHAFTSPSLSPSSILSTKRTPRPTKSASGIWSFLSRKTEGIIHRVSGATVETHDTALARHSSLDLGSVFSPSSRSSWRMPRASEEDPRPAPVVAQTNDTIKASQGLDEEEEERRDRERFGPFTSTIRRIQAQHCILSTSPKVIFPPPPIVARLAQREDRLKSGSHASFSSGSSLASSTSSMTIPIPGSLSHGPPSLRLTGVDKTGLGSVLGWENREARGRGMTGIKGFVRHQGLTILYSERVAAGEELYPCGRPRTLTYRYWARTSTTDADRDRTLGEVIERSCETAAMEEVCDREGCGKPRKKHRLSWICGGVKVEGAVTESMGGSGSNDGVEIWQTCAMCSKMTERVEMDDETYLFSFAKYLELLIWSPILSSLSLCDHISSPTPRTPLAGDRPLSGSRFHILRHFAHKGHILTLTLTSLHDELYDVRLPKLQIISGSIPKEEKHLSDAKKRQENEEERQALETEMSDWWHEIKIKLDKLESFLEKEIRQSLESKDLPPLPASDEEASDDETSSQQPSLSMNAQGPGLTSTSGLLTTSHPGQPRSSNVKSCRPAAPYPPGSSLSFRQSRKQLRQLRISFQRTEDSLRRQARDTPISSLNDLRRAFRSTAQGASKRLTAWQVKHTPGASVDAFHGRVTSAEPEWWSNTCYAVPGGRVVVREGEWGSVIAFTLSSLDYQRELANLNMAFPTSSPALSTTTLSELQSLTPTTTVKPTKQHHKNLDPDDVDTSSWEESESWTAVISRREHPREMSALVSLRDVLRTKHSFDTSSLGSRFSGSVSRGVANVTPPSAWALPQVNVNLEPADGRVSLFPEATEVVEKILESQYPIHSHHQVETTTTSNYNLSDAGEVTPTPSNFVERHNRTDGRSALMAVDVPAEGRSLIDHPIPKPVLAPSSFSESGTTPSANSFSGALSSAMRYFLNVAPSRAPSPTPPGTHHGLLAFETSSIDDRPHIKYEWAIGKRLQFSCTVYYAKQFDALRKKCGVDDVVIKSLGRSENWTAEGGKSKSNFWKSSDDRFIIKTLVNAWNVADLQVLIELAPSYFRYIDSTASKASVLAKLMGFYTVEVKNLETGAVRAKHDLLVMENLFYKQKVTKTFDLKGIQSRRVKLNHEGTGSRTWFDGEWIEGQQRAPLLIHSNCGYILQEAIKADADFLAKSNIMDYSLLLGVDEECHEISCGLVDTIGSYTFAKTLEYKAKQNLHSGKEVTVIPPTEYHQRFVSSMETYFLTCPDKWTKPPHFVDRTKATELASVV
ncbi:hypothetical protein K439DRAFT_1633470 [Ramaria rubella]|nr:hypothetical protein K439DRAFT_1633470 [Ramaria rubella]